jgi:hypothetical protein
VSTLVFSAPEPTPEGRRRALEVLHAAQAYADAETARLNGPSPTAADPTIPDLSPFPHDATQDGESVLFALEPGYGAHRFDIPMFFFLKAATVFRGSILLNSRQAPKVLGRSKFHVRMDFPRARGAARLNIQVNRIVANAQPGERIVENPHDYHDHRPEGLSRKPSHDRRTRQDAVMAALRHYDLAPAVDPAKATFTRTAYKELLWRLLTLADARWAERATLDAIATAPWAHADLV